MSSQSTGRGTDSGVETSLDAAGRSACATVLLALFLISSAHAQTTGATFGNVIPLGGTPSDIVLDEPRGKLYLVNSNAARVDIYNYLEHHRTGSFAVGPTPLAGA